MKKIMENEGYVFATCEKDAAIILLLTCSVRNHAEARALSKLTNLKKDGKIVGVLGCMAQNKKSVLISEFHADLVVGPDGYRQLPFLLRQLARTKMPQIYFELTNECYEGISPTQVEGKVTSFVTIMRGCNNFCSYCIVPYVRGRERSKSCDEILAEARLLGQAGVKEVTLVGQNVLAYRHNGLCFCDLIKEVASIPQIERIRFITAHPKDFSPRVIETLATIKKVCPNIHLPLQSGSNRILGLMNRHYTKEEYLAKIKLARQYIPDVVFTTDLMVGFPTETEADFEETLAAVTEIRFDFAYMFKYSPRPGTTALKLAPEVDASVAQKRLEQLIRLQTKITKENNQVLIGKEFEVLVESLKEHNGGKQAIGRTKTNKIVVLDRTLPIGEIVWVKVIGISGWTLKGEVIAKEGK